MAKNSTKDTNGKSDFAKVITALDDRRLEQLLEYAEKLVNEGQGTQGKGSKAKAQTAIVKATPKSRARKGDMIEPGDILLWDEYGSAYRELSAGFLNAADTANLKLALADKFKFFKVHPSFRGAQTTRVTFNHLPPAILAGLRALDSVMGACEPEWQELWSIVIAGEIDRLLTKNEQRKARRDRRRAVKSQPTPAQPAPKKPARKTAASAAAGAD